MKDKKTKKFHSMGWTFCGQCERCQAEADVYYYDDCNCQNAHPGED